MICTSLDCTCIMKKGAGMQYRYAVPSEKNSCVGNVSMIHNAAIHAVARAGERKDTSFSEMTRNWVSLLLFYWMISFPSTDVIRPHRLRPLSYRLWHTVMSHSTMQKTFAVAVLYGVYRTGQANDFQLIPTVKMETRHPVEASFDNEFPSICKHCKVVAAWSRKTLEKIWNF